MNRHLKYDRIVHSKQLVRKLQKGILPPGAVCDQAISTMHLRSLYDSLVHHAEKHAEAQAPIALLPQLSDKSLSLVVLHHGVFQPRMITLSLPGSARNS